MSTPPIGGSTCPHVAINIDSHSQQIPPPTLSSVPGGPSIASDGAPSPEAPRQPPTDDKSCPICLTDGPLGTELKDRTIFLPCHPAHFAHLSCYIGNYASSMSQGRKCPQCRVEYDIIDPVIFAHLQPKENEERTVRYERISQLFKITINIPTFLAKTEAEQKKEIAQLLLGSDTLSPAVLTLIGDPWSLENGDTKTRRLIDLYRRAFYVEQLGSAQNPESAALFHARHLIFAKRVAPSRNDEISRKILKEAETINSGRPFANRHYRDTITIPASQANNNNNRAPFQFHRAYNDIGMLAVAVALAENNNLAAGLGGAIQGHGAAARLDTTCWEDFSNACIETGMWFWMLLYCVLMCFLVWVDGDARYNY